MTRRRLLYVAFLVVSSLAALVWSAIHTGFVIEPLRVAVQTELSAALGTEVSIERLHLGAQGLSLENVLVYAAMAEGVRSPVLSVARARLFFDWWSLVGGTEPRLAGVELEHAFASLDAGLAEASPSSTDTPRAPDASVWRRMSAVVDRVLELGLVWCRVSDLTIWARAGPGGTPLGLRGSELRCARRGEELELALSVPEVLHDEIATASLRARATADASSLQLNALALTTPGAVAWAKGSLRWARTPVFFEASGGVELSGAPLSRALRELEVYLPQGVAVRADRALASVEVEGPVDDPGRWLGRARLSLGRPALDLPSARAAIELDALYLEAERSAGALRFGAMRAHGPGFQAQAVLEVPDDATRVLSGSLSFSDLESLHRAFPDSPWPGRLRPRLQVGGRVALSAEVRFDDARTQASGQLEGAGLLLRAGPVGDVLLSSLATRFEYRSGPQPRLSLQRLSLRGPRGELRGSVRLERGRHHADLKVDRLDARVLSSVLPGSIGRGAVDGTLRVHGSFDRPFERLSARLHARDLSWQSPEAQLRPAAGAWVAAVELDHVSAHVARDREGWRFAEVEIDGSASVPRVAGAWVRGTIRGEGSLGERDHHLELAVEALDARVLNAVLPLTIDKGVLHGELIVDGDVEAPLERLRGTVALSDGGFRPPPQLHGPPVIGVRFASAELARTADGWQLSDVRLESSEGAVHGRIGWNEGGHHHALATFEPVAGGFFAALVPGRLDAGVARVTVDLRGTRDAPLETAQGRVTLRKARWTLPAAAGLCLKSLSIRHAAADYTWDAAGLRLGDVRLDASAFQARGDVAVTPQKTRVEGSLATRHADTLLDAFPELSGLLRGGHGTARVRVETSASGTSGVVEGQIEGGRLEIKSVSGVRPNRHPVKAASFAYEFEPGRRRIRKLDIRGSELNVTLDAAWSERGPLNGRGRLWLTPAYTSEIAHGAGWLLSLLGYSPIETKFTLSGTASDVRLDAEMAHGWRWRLLRIAVPERLERIGRGEAPVFTDEELGPCTSDERPR